VNAVCPGFIESDMTEKLDLDGIKKAIPLGRLGKASEVRHFNTIITAFQTMVSVDVKEKDSTQPNSTYDSGGGDGEVLGGGPGGALYHGALL